MICIYSPSEKIWGGGQIYIEGLCRYMNEKACQLLSQPQSLIHSLAPR